MALGKPVVTFLHDEAVRRTEERLRRPRADRQRDAETLHERLEELVAIGAVGPGRDRPGVARATSSRCTTSSSSPTGSSRSTTASSSRRGARATVAGRAAPPADPRPTLPLGDTRPRRDGPARRAPARGPQAMPGGPRQPAPPARPPLGDLRDRRPRLARHRRPPAARSTRATSPRRLRPDRDAARPDHRDGADPPRRDHERLLPLLLRRRRRRRPPACPAHIVLVHDGRRDARARCSCSRSRSPSRRSSSGPSDAANLVRASGVALWATVNYEQLTALFRVEERSVAFVSASLANVFLTIGLTLLLVVVLEKGPLGVIVGNFSGTLIVYLSLLGYRREQLGLEFDRGLLREMNRFGIPLVPTALFLWMTNFSDRFFLVWLADVAEAGLYSVGVRDRVGDGAPADGVPHGVAGVRVLDPRRARGTTDVRLRAHVPDRRSPPGWRSR